MLGNRDAGRAGATGKRNILERRRTGGTRRDRGDEEKLGSELKKKLRQKLCSGGKSLPSNQGRARTDFYRRDADTVQGSARPRSDNGEDILADGGSRRDLLRGNTA